jgi:putative glutamine amidotransferase
MSRIVAITQRVDVLSGRHERRDALDQKWTSFLKAADFIPLLLPNDSECALALMNQIKVAGIVFSGGNDLAELGGDAPERDHNEQELLSFAREKELPVLGVCRGMQFLVCALGGSLQPVSDHVRTEHAVVCGQQREMVNSFHTWGVGRLPAELRPTAVCSDGTVEAVAHECERLQGIMWHPERNQIFSSSDLRRFSEFFARDSK